MDKWEIKCITLFYGSDIDIFTCMWDEWMTDRIEKQATTKED